jgi:crotonobetainyl-CoA:carnitine CoA-transferase CaiB-like acyl-CoA transferase
MSTLPVGALRGLRVLDMSRILAGPLATQTLADLGAEVIKIERPGSGDDTRGWGPPFLQDGEGRDTQDSTYFACCNRGKKSVTVDLSHAQGQQLLRELAAQCDVLVENYKVGDLARFGLDFASLERTHPRLVYCSITGYGQTGPCAARPGYDPIAQAIGGLMSVTGERDGRPQRVGVAVVDVLTASYAVIAIQAALRHRDATGAGQYIDLALLDVQMASMINVAQAYLSAGIVGWRNGNEHPSVVPSQSFECEDGMIMLAAANDGQFARLCQALGCPELALDERFRTNGERVRNRDALNEVLNARFRRAPVAHWTQTMVAAGLPCGPVNTIDQAFADAQVRARGMRVELEHPVAGVLPVLASPLRLSASPVAYQRAPPLLGQHTESVLAELLGLDAQRIAGLRAAGAI